MLRHKWSVVHAGRRDQYEVASALFGAGALHRLLTDFYTPDWLLRGLGRTFPEKAAAFRARHNPDLPSRHAASSLAQALGPIVAIGWCRLDPVRSYLWLEGLLSRRATRHALANPGIGLLVYNYYWQSVGDARGSRAWRGPGVVFQVHPISEQIRAILDEDRSKTGLTYGIDREEVQTPEEGRRYRQALEAADGVFAASSFTARGLLEQGVPPENIAIVPYGIDLVRPVPRPSGEDPHWRAGLEPLRLLWVGQVAYRKGPHHLFEAIRRFPKGSVELSLVTRTEIPRQLWDMAPDNVRVYRSVSDATRERMYATHHLFVMPSLVEGFGLAYLEALANGLPVLGTPNTGAPDIIRDEIEGFIVQAGDPDAIVRCIERCLSEPAVLPAMSEAARRSVATWTWARFRSGIVEGLERFENAFDSRP